MQRFSGFVCALMLPVLGVIAGCHEEKAPPPQWQSENGYSFERGYPVGGTAQRAYDENDLNRAVEAYKFFYPTVSGEAIFRENKRIGIVPNKPVSVATPLNLPARSPDRLSDAVSTRCLSSVGGTSAQQDRS